MLDAADGRQILVGLCGRGEFFGALQLFANTPKRDTTVVATTPTTVLQIRAEDARRVAQRNPKAMAFIYRRYAELSVRLSKFIVGLVTQDVPGRVAWLLFELSHLKEQPHLTQEQIADMIGASRRAVSGVLSDLAGRRIVDVRPGAIRVLDESALRA